MRIKTSLFLQLLLTIILALILFSVSLAAPGGRLSHSTRYTPPHQTYQTDIYKYNPKSEGNRNGSHEEDTEVGKMDQTMQELDQQRDTDAETMPTPKDQQDQQDQQDKNESDRKGNHCEDSNTNKSDCSQEIGEEHPEEAFYDTH